MDLFDVYIKDKKSPLIKKSIDNDLLKLGLDETFLKALIDSDGIVAGFFVLECLKKKWKKIITDIDIFVESTKYIVYNKVITDPNQLTPVENWLWKKTNYNAEQFDGDCMKFEEDAKEEFYYKTNSSLPKTINRVRTYNLDKVKVQVISIKKIKGGVSNFIETKFDLKYCKCMYNGKKLKIAENNLQSIKDESSDYKDADVVQSIYAKHFRCLKYLDRGFKITNYTVPKKLIIPIIKRVDGKKKKTYKLKLHPHDQVYFLRLLDQNRPDIKIRYNYKDKIYEHGSITINEIEEHKKRGEEKKQKELNSASYILKQYFPTDIANIIHRYYDIGKKVYKIKNYRDFEDRGNQNMKEVLLNILEYLKISSTNKDKTLYDKKFDKYNKLKIYAKNELEADILFDMIKYVLISSDIIANERPYLFYHSSGSFFDSIYCAKSKKTYERIFSIENYVKWKDFCAEISEEFKMKDNTIISIFADLKGINSGITIEEVQNYVKRNFDT